VWDSQQPKFPPLRTSSQSNQIINRQELLHNTKPTNYLTTKMFGTKRLLSEIHSALRPHHGPQPQRTFYGWLNSIFNQYTTIKITLPLSDGGGGGGEEERTRRRWWFVCKFFQRNEQKVKVAHTRTTATRSLAASLLNSPPQPAKKRFSVFGVN